MNYVEMAESSSSANVDPAIFKHLQEKIDEEGKVRDVHMAGSPFFVKHLTVSIGVERDCADAREARRVKVHFVRLS